MLRWCAIATTTLLAAAAGCGGAPHAVAPAVFARACEVQHTFHGEDTVDGHVSRLDDGWMVALRMSVRLSEDQPAVQVRGLGRVTDESAAHACQVVEANGEPGSPRFDESLCLDEFESLADIVSDAEHTARPGETVVQEIRLRRTRRHRTRSRVTSSASFQETAEITRDTSGRVVRVARTSAHGGREEIVVTYPASEHGRCLPAE